MRGKGCERSGAARPASPAAEAPHPPRPVGPPQRKGSGKAGQARPAQPRPGRAHAPAAVRRRPSGGGRQSAAGAGSGGGDAGRAAALPFLAGEPWAAARRSGRVPLPRRRPPPLAGCRPRGLPVGLRRGSADGACPLWVRLPRVSDGERKLVVVFRRALSPCARPIPPPPLSPALGSRGVGTWRCDPAAWRRRRVGGSRGGTGERPTGETEP